MADLTLLIFAIAIFVANYFFTGWFIRYAKVKRITDYPTDRSSHNVPTPRGGGVGFVAMVTISTFTYMFLMGVGNYIELLILITASAIVAILGWFDDKNDLSKRVRFSIQLLSALLVLIFIHNFDELYLLFGTEISLGYFGGLLGLIWITGNTNIYNFMDGIDGIASVQALAAAFGWAVFALFWNEPTLMAFNVFIFCAIGAFLIFNWAPAKIFMGDVGSVYLGFIFGAMPFFAAYLVEPLSIGMSIWIGGLLLWPFLFDGAFTIFRRLYRKENIFEAHRSHLYQQMNIAGWSHPAISITYLFFSILCVIFSLLFYHGEHVFQMILIVTLAALSFIFSFIVLKLKNNILKK